ncbi:alpha-ketoglutarate-dependent dioxygenase AlkB [uncultured Kordia sp.]|uniref:alpha-ketoglutarate-dependent dioxygenase AlkB n=1 Tax=uncultured Kordia sp. TaxID=507699 RepID=UPI002631AD38|nr:alpha-ketoglutarate-dependent dioxygenase AlkB [uncultured Kordia sp.]
MKTSIKLPLNCSAEYVEEFLSKEESESLYTQLISEYKIAKQSMKITVDNNVIDTDICKIMFLDKDLYDKNKFPEQVWGKTAIWSNELKKVKQKVEAFTDINFSVCVCIYYSDGTSGVTYHSDHSAFGDTTIIPSISIGEERMFYLREKESQKVHDILLKEGSMLIMGENCQERYEHSLPINPSYKKGRINLTFRQYGFKS